MTRQQTIAIVAFSLLCVVCIAQTATVAPAAPLKDVQKCLQRSQEFISANRLAEAEALLTQCYALAPEEDRVITLLAQVKSRLGEPQESVKLFQKVASAQPNSATAHLNLAIALADTSQEKDALAEIEKAIHLDQNSAQGHLNRARLLTDLHRPIDAGLEFVTASRLNATDPDIYFFWGVLERDNHHVQTAATMFAKALALQPNNLRALILLGQAQQALGETEEELATWKKAVALDPSSEEATYALSQALRRTDPAASGQLLQRFEALHTEKMNREHIRELGNQAYAAMQRQDWHTAIATLHQAIEQCAGCSLQSDLHQRLGLADCHSGDLIAGESELRLALSLNPNDRVAVEALQWISAQFHR